MCTNVIN